MPALRRTAIVFDLDGTLVDSAPDLCDALNRMLARRGRPPVEPAAIRAMIGDGARALVRRGLEGGGGVGDEAAFEAAVAEFLAHYDAHLADRSRPFPGVIEALTQLSAAGCRLGVCTNKAERFSRKLLDALGLGQFFAAVVGGDSLPARKPDPAHLVGALAQMGARPAEAVMVGDSANDVAAARGAGVPVVVVSFGYTRTPAAALGGDRLIDHFDELAAALAALA
jgi:phosphoglycolate phosphatase